MYAALVCNLAIVSVKFMVYGVSRSSAMLAETIHSLADSLDQILLLLGESRGRRPPDADNPLGDGMETYFWSFIVAIMVLFLGGGASLYQGIGHKLFPVMNESPTLSLAALGIAAVLKASRLR